MPFNELNSVKQTEYHSPDDVWKTLYKIESKEEHIEKFVLKGRFHVDVHQDVQKSYVTVEYLMALSYYHWQLYDEALKKLLGIFEIAIKKRCLSLDIPIKKTNHQGKTKSIFLGELIKKLQKKGYPDDITFTMNSIRELRNHFAHPDRHSFGGAFFKGHILPILNTVNELFLPVQYFSEKESIYSAFKSRLKSLHQKVLILPHNTDHILVYNPLLISVFKVNSQWHGLFSFEGVLPNPQKFVEDERSLTPLTLILRNIEIFDDKIQGIDIKSGKALTVMETTKKENIEKYKSHLEVLDNLGIDEKFHINAPAQRMIADQLSETIYFNCWPEMQIIDE